MSNSVSHRGVIIRITSWCLSVRGGRFIVASRCGIEKPCRTNLALDYTINGVLTGAPNAGIDDEFSSRRQRMEASTTPSGG